MVQNMFRSQSGKVRPETACIFHSTMQPEQVKIFSSLSLTEHHVLFYADSETIPAKHWIWTNSSANFPEYLSAAKPKMIIFTIWKIPECMQNFVWAWMRIISNSAVTAVMIRWQETGGAIREPSMNVSAAHHISRFRLFCFPTKSATAESCTERFHKVFFITVTKPDTMRMV